MKKGLLPILGRVPMKEQKQDRLSVPEELREESWNFSTSGIHLQETNGLRKQLLWEVERETTHSMLTGIASTYLKGAHRLLCQYIQLLPSTAGISFAHTAAPALYKLSVFSKFTFPVHMRSIRHVSVLKSGEKIKVGLWNRFWYCLIVPYPG